MPKEFKRAPRSALTLDHRFDLTLFRSVRATSADRVQWTVGQLLQEIRDARAPQKSDLPLLKLGTFGTLKSAKGSLRHDANVLEVTGIEVDYDGGEVPRTEAAKRLRAAGIGAVVYDTPSSTPEAPRWRALIFCLRPVTPSERRKLVARVNGAIGGIAAGESFALSQVFFFGRVDDGPHEPEVEFVEGAFIDQRPDLDNAAMDPPAKSPGLHLDDAFRQVKSDVDWARVYGAVGLEALRREAPDLVQRLESDLAKNGKLAERWKGGVQGLKDKSRSARDKSMMQILRSLGFNATDAISLAVAWGCDNPAWGRGLDELDNSYREMDLDRYWVRNWLRDTDRPVQSVAELKATAKLVKPTTRTGPPVFPKICRELPGMLGQLASYLDRASYRVLPPELLISVSLQTLAHALQNRFLVGDERSSTPIALYLLVVAKTGGGKTDLGKSMSELFGSSIASEGLLGDVASGPALLKHLDRLSPGMPWGPCLLLMMDEFGFRLAARTIRSGSHAKEIIDEIIRLYGQGDSIHRGKAYAELKQQIGSIVRPNVQVLGFTTEQPVVDALTLADADQGFTNRFLLVRIEYADLPIKRQSDVDKRPPSSITKFLRNVGTAEFRLPPSRRDTENLEALTGAGVGELAAALRSQEPGSIGLAVGARMTPHYIALSTDAAIFVDGLIDLVNAKTSGASSVPASSWARAIQQVQIVAGVLAISTAELDTPTVPVISKAHCEWAWEYVVWSIESWIDFLQTKVGRHDEERNARTIKDLIDRVWDFATGGPNEHEANYGNAKYNSEACGVGVMPRSVIGRLTRLKSDDIGQAIGALLLNEEIEVVEVVSDTGRKVKGYRSLG